MKTCRKCQAEKGPDDFRKSRPTCRQCENEACKAYGANNRPKRNARLARWRTENPEKTAKVDRRKRLKKYGLTEECREKMEEKQNGACLLCFRKMPLVIDHCHTSGRVRGLLCSRCNTNLGWIETHPGIIARIQSYTTP